MAECPHETESDFSGKITGIMMNGLAAFGLELGWKLGLFDTLAGLDGPRTAHEIAEKLNLKERYVEEWLLQMTCLKIVDVSADDSQYTLPAHRRSALVNPALQNCMMKHAILSWGRLFNDMSECFKIKGPRGLPYSKYEGCDELLKGRNEKIAELNPHFTEQLIDSVPDLAAKLCEGISACEIACGHGGMLLELATRNPKSHFIGVEYQQPYVTQGNDKARELQLSNLQFEHGDATNLPDEWSKKFDCVLVYTAIHDLSRPDLGVKEIHRILKDDGVFVMVDMFRRSENDDQTAMLYGISLIECVAPTMFDDEGWGVGCQWEKEKAQEILHKTGFAITSEGATPKPDKMSTLLVCHKV